MSGISEITGQNYASGFCEGFLQRNRDIIEGGVPLHQNQIYFDDATRDVIGAIDLSFEISHETLLQALFPAKAFVQTDEQKIGPCRIFFELMASKGETIVSKSSNGKISRLAKKIYFYNKFVDFGVVGPADYVAFVYNGSDPATVKVVYDTISTKHFRRCVVHFQRAHIDVWAAEEELAKSFQAVEESAARIAESEERDRRAQEEIERLRAALEEVRAIAK